MTNDTQLTLNMIRYQLRGLEREIARLQEKLALAAPPATPPRSFAALRGIWADVVFDEQDIEASRLKMPEGL